MNNTAQAITNLRHSLDAPADDLGHMRNAASSTHAYANSLQRQIKALDHRVTVLEADIYNIYRHLGI